MLKHTSNISGSTNGLIRNDNNVPQRGIYLRSQNPLHISTISTNSGLQTPISVTSANGSRQIGTLGERLSTNCPITLLNINGTGNEANHRMSTTTTTTTTQLAPINSITENSIANNTHTYTNTNLNDNINEDTNILLLSTNNKDHLNKSNYNNCNNLTGVFINQSKPGPGPQEALTSLGLLCVVSLLLALLSLTFLLKISPNARQESVLRNATEDFTLIYDITLAVGALSLSLNLCCLLVCAIQFLFAVKLVRSPKINSTANNYLEKSKFSRSCAIVGFFISIPIFLTGVILYAFNHFHSTPAIITSAFIGIGIVFCGGALVHNVFIWQKEKTLCYSNAQIHRPSIQQIAVPISTPMHFLSSQNLINFNASNLPVAADNTTTPASPNNSQSSFNAINATQNNSIYLLRPSSEIPATPKPVLNSCVLLNSREHNRSISPVLSPILDVSHISTITPHELSTLV